MKNITIKSALERLRSVRHRLTRQQLKTLRGQILAGDADGAMKGITRILDDVK